MNTSEAMDSNRIMDNRREKVVLKPRKVLWAIMSVVLGMQTANAQLSITPAEVAVCTGVPIEFSAQGAPPNAQLDWYEAWDAPNGFTHHIGSGPSIDYYPYQSVTILLRATTFDPAINDTLVQIATAQVTVSYINVYVNTTDASCFQCPDGAFELNVSGPNPPFTLLFNGTTTTNTAFTGLLAGEYQIVVTDSFGCSADVWAWIGYVPSFQVDLGPENVLIPCGESYNLTLNVTPEGEYQNIWRVYCYADGQEYVYQNQDQVTVQGASTVQVEVTNIATGETNYATVFVDYQPLEITGTVTDASCDTCQDGSITLEPMGTPPFTYQWHPNGDTTATITDLAPGYYDVYVTDATGCQGWRWFQVGPLPTDTSNTWLPTDEHVLVPCGSNDTIVIQAYPPPGVDEESILWYNEQGDTVGTGTYLVLGVQYSQWFRVIAHGANGQTLYGYVWVEVDGPSLELVNLHYPSCETCSDGSATFEVENAVPPLIVQCGETTLTFSEFPIVLDGLPYGDYQIFATDSNGCTGVAYFSFYADDTTVTVIEVDVSGPETTGCGQTITLVGQAPEPTNQFNFWLNEAGDTLGYGTELTISLIQPTYFKFVSIDTATGQRWEGVHFVNVQGFPVSGSTSPATCQTCADGQIHLNEIGGTAPYTFAWSNGATTQNVGGLEPGYYWVTVTDATGCSTTVEFVVGCIGGSVAINGVVIYQDSTHAPATVHLITYDPATEETAIVATETTNEQGYFAFEIPAVNGLSYYLLAETETQGYIPTYYPSAYAIQEAHAIAAEGCTQYFATIEFVHLEDCDGDGNIDGEVDEDGSGKTAETRPAENLPLILIFNDKPVRRYVTDANGKFKFQSLGMGTYRIHADKMGVNNTLAPQVSLTSDNPSVNLSLVLYPDRLAIAETTARGHLTPSHGLTVYPNPTRNFVTLRFRTVGPATLEIVDLAGKPLNAMRFNGGEHNVTLCTENMPRGTYIAKISSDDGISSFRLILE